LFVVGPFALILFLVGFFLLIRWVGFQNLLSLIGLFALLGRSRREPREQQVPVYYLDIRDASEDRRRARLKGFYTHANIRAGDRVRLQGRWRNGVFFVERGAIQNPDRSRISLRRERRWIWLLSLTLAGYTLLLLELYRPLSRLVHLLFR